MTAAPQTIKPGEVTPPPKQPGIKGRAVTLSSNYYPLQLRGKKLYTYLMEFPATVSAEDTALRFSIYKSIASAIDAKFAFHSFDGSVLSTATKVDHSLTFTTKSNDVVTVSPQKELDSNNAAVPEVNAVVNKLTKQLLKRLSYVQLGRSYYEPQPVDLPGPVDIRVLRGFSLSVMSCTAGLQLNIELAHRVLHKRNVREMMNEIESKVKNNSRGANTEALWSNIVQAVNDELRGGIILTTNNRRIFRIDHVAYEKSFDSTFKLRDGTETSFREYYKQRYNIDLQGKGRGLLVYEQRGKHVQDPIYLIPDLCNLTGVNEKCKSDQRMTVTRPPRTPPASPCSARLWQCVTASH